MKKIIDINKVYGIPEDSLKSSIFRLAHFQPSIEVDKDHQIIDYLVLDALSTQGELFEASLDDLQSIIQSQILLEFELQEILESVRRLSRSKAITAKSLDKGLNHVKISISDSKNNYLAIKREELKRIEQDSISEWKSEIIERYEGDDAVKENLDKIELSLKLFLSRMFLKHGIESVSILYPEQEKTKGWVKSIEKQISNSLPHYNDYLDSIIRIEVPRFIKSTDPSRKKYLANLFNASFYWHLIHIDSKGSKLLTTITKGQRLLLDNNILYNLVGIGGEEQLRASHKLINLANELGYKIQITSKTIEEFQDSLKWHMYEARKRPPITRELARLALSNLGQDNFMTSYWDGLAKKHITLEEFVLEVSHIHDILDGLKIEVFHKYQKDIDDSQELIDEMSLLTQACGDHYNEHIVEHDAFHRILIQKLRKRTRYSFKDAVAWFLTQDSKLPSYSKYARRGQEYLPFCLTTNQWIQLNRPFLSRTKNESEYEESLVSLITQPFLRSIIPQHPLQDSYEKVLGRLSRYENMSPELASEITSDMHFMLSISKIDDSDEAATIDDKVDEQIARKNHELRQELEQLRAEVKKDSKASSEKIENLEKRLELIQNFADETKVEKANLEFEKSGLIEKHQKELSTKKIQLIQKVEEQIEDYRINELKSWQAKVWWNLFWVVPITMFIIWIGFFPESIGVSKTDLLLYRVIIGFLLVVVDGIFISLVRSRYFDEGNKNYRMSNTKPPANLREELNRLKAENTPGKSKYH